MMWNVINATFATEDVLFERFDLGIIPNDLVHIRK
jgi:hypothetical protein